MIYIMCQRHSSENAMRVKHTRSDIPKPLLDGPSGEVLLVTVNSTPSKEWCHVEKRQAAIANRKREAQG